MIILTDKNFRIIFQRYSTKTNKTIRKTVVLAEREVDDLIKQLQNLKKEREINET